MPTHLKSLELQGYKTFASRTLFEFGDRVTAIVGPNGSGKSNIADSMRWVLGEQSYSLLRGKKTEDMIFSGSEFRSRAGMASATITFDNSEGWLPIDFSEVAITRRAYRDGQNEYLINRQRVRLKDVSELLSQSGLAERTYTIIGQGLVDAALALKAEERRRLFEEAAGTGLHRARREEALRRLEITQRNLERVQDILAELQPRLRSLERQARRAQEYEQIKADLQVVLREWYGFHWHRAQEDLTRAWGEVRRQESGLERARSEQERLSQALAHLREQIQSLRASLNEHHRQSAKLHARREELSRELAVAEERLRSYQEQQQNLSSEWATWHEEFSQHQERLSAARLEVEHQESELQEAGDQVERARQALADRLAERTVAEKELQEARQALSEIQGQRGNLQARLVERKLQIERGQISLEEHNQAVKTIQAELQEMERRARQAEVACEQAEAALHRVEEENSAHQKSLQAAEAERQAALERRAARSAELAGVKTRMDVLEQAEKALSGYAGGTRALLEAARQAKLSGVRGALSSFLDVPVEYETAIVAVLGEFLDAVLLEDKPEQALDILAKEAGRGALLPLGALSPEERFELDERLEAEAVSHSNHNAQENGPSQGVIGVAADLVLAPPELRPAVDLLLGQVLVVSDRRTACLVLAGQPGHLRAVTLQGEVFFANGPILACTPGGAVSGETLLSRQRQQRELKKHLETSQQDLQALQKRIRELDERVRQLREEAAQLSQKQNAARHAASQVTLERDQARLAAEQSKRQVNWQQEQAQRLQDQMREWQAEAAQLVRQMGELDEKVEEARVTLRHKSSALAALPLEEHQAQINHWSTRAAVAERALADSRSHLSERQGVVEAALRTQQSLQVRISELTRSAEELAEGKSARRQAESELASQIEKLQELIEPAEAELERLENEQSTLQSSEAASRQALSISEHHHAQARITLARRQEALDSLRRRVEDDFGLVSFEYTDQVSGPTPLPLQGLVEQLPLVSQLSPEVEETIRRQRAQLRRIGAINPEAQAEYLEVKQRFEFLTDQVADLHKAEADVRQVIAELDELMEREFRRTFDAVAAEFREIFTRLFGGGAARLVLTDEEDLTNTGIDIEARLPGRRAQGLSLLSGGERSLTAAALVFALLKVSPTPFCVLDEVDAMLDEANVARFRELLRELSQNTQFIVVTHNRNTVQAAEVIYGVTMGRDSASQVISLRLDQVGEVVE